jgi:hypothetical protein
MRKFGIILKSAGIVAVLLIIKWIIFKFDGEIVVANPVITALVAGVIFTIAIIFSGVLADYKESEKIPGELTAIIKSLYNDTNMLTVKDEKTRNALRAHIKDLLRIIVTNFKSNSWPLNEIDPAINHIADDIAGLAREGIAPPFVVKMRNDLAGIDKLSYRIKIIMETSFIPVAYYIAIIATVAVMVILLCTKMEHYHDSLLLFGSVSFILISLLMLIKDMDNPFEYGKKTSADIDLSVLFNLEKEMENR